MCFTMFSNNNTKLKKLFCKYDDVKRSVIDFIMTKRKKLFLSSHFLFE